MRDYLRDLITRYRSPGILLDANLLLLLLVGDLSPARLQRFKPVDNQFVVGDYGRLRDILADVDRFVVTPHILTEASGLLGKASSHELTHLLRSVLVQSIEQFDIHEIPVHALLGSSDDRDVLCKFGLTDAGIIHLARQGYLAVTIDFPLTKYLESEKLDAINYKNASGAFIADNKWE